jgi:23S rRNA A2030 N6-methylase RlmJ
LTDELIKQVALLAWIPPSEVKAYHDKLIETQEKQQKRSRDGNLIVYIVSNQRINLESVFKQLKLFTSSKAKHQLEQLISYKRNEESPPETC